MNTKIPQEQAELKRHLVEQIAFLEASASAYDAGYESESKRLAVTLRVLLHDSGRSKSLLAQLGMRSGLFVDSAVPRDPRDQASYTGLVAIEVGPSGGRYVPFLDETAEPVRLIEFDEWWNTPVFASRGGASLSREKLVLTMANQDGGAHVDPALDPFYARISRQNELGWVHHTQHGQTALTGKEMAAVRQIAHEVLKTLRPAYNKTFPTAPGAYAIVGGRCWR